MMYNDSNDVERHGEDYGKQVGSPASLGRFSSNGGTLPSSHGSCESIDSGDASVLAPPPVHDDRSDASSVETSRCTTTKILLMTTAFLLLFSAGLLGGLLATGGFSRDSSSVSSTNAGNSEGSVSTASPSMLIHMVDHPTAAPSFASKDQKPTWYPTESPTETTAGVTRIPIPSPPTPDVFPDGSYNYRANSEYLVGVYVQERTRNARFCKKSNIVISSL
jgi:hypothetical protein